MQNYRLINSTSVIGKMFESVIADNIRQHIDTHNLIHDSQHGFIKGSRALLIFYPFTIEYMSQLTETRVTV